MNALETQELYWNTMATSISDKVAINHWVDVDQNPLDEKLFKEISTYLQKKFIKTDGGSILEIGCGNGLILENIKNSLNKNWKLYGTDISEEMLKRVNISDVTLFNTDASKIPCDGATFDLIYLHSVVQYFESEEYFDRVVMESHRLLKPGAFLCFLDVPLNWYEPYMRKGGTSIRFSTRVRLLLEKKAPILVDLYRKLQSKPKEVVNGVEIDFPAAFKGLYVNPDRIYSFSKDFESIVIEMQPFLYKPISYRKFRFNFIFEKA